jgi:hypothetical protein
VSNHEYWFQLKWPYWCMIYTKHLTEYGVLRRSLRLLQTREYLAILHLRSCNHACKIITSREILRKATSACVNINYRRQWWPS